MGQGIATRLMLWDDRTAFSGLLGLLGLLLGRSHKGPSFTSLRERILITKKCSSLKGQGIGLKGQVLIGLRGRIRGLGDRIWNGLEDLGLVGELRAVASDCLISRIVVRVRGSTRPKVQFCGGGIGEKRLLWPQPEQSQPFPLT
jgi:hypothetical protein